MGFGGLGAEGGAFGGGSAAAQWALAPDVGVDLDFINDRGFNMNSGIASALSFITATSAAPTNGGASTVDDLAGNWTTFTAANAKRRSNKGLLVEEPRTNGIRNNSMVNAAVGASGTLPAITSLNRSGSATANVTFNSAHGIPTNTIIIVSGASVASYNGAYKFVSTGANTGTYLTTVNTSDSATGASATFQRVGTFPTNWVPRATDQNLSLAIVNMGVQNGIDYLECRLAGIPDTSLGTYLLELETNSGYAAVQNDVIVDSVFLQSVGGSTANISNLSFDNVEYPGGADRGNGTTAIGTISSIAWTRMVNLPITVLSVGAANVQPRLNIGYISTSAAVDWTFRIGWPQAEKGNFVTSPIRTVNSGNVTRDRDIITLTSVPSFGANNTCTLYAKAVAPPATYDFAQVIWCQNDVNNRVGLYRPAGRNANFQSLRSGTPNFTLNPTTWGDGATGALAGAMAPGAQSACFNGANLVTNTVADPSWAGAVSQIHIGEYSGSAWNSFIHRIGIWPTIALSSTRLQALPT